MVLTKHSGGHRQVAGTSRFIRYGVVPLLSLVALLGPCRAGSAVQAASTTSGPVRLDFRITVLPSLSMSALATGMRIQSNSGALVLQRDRRDESEDRAATAVRAQLQPRHLIVDTLLSAKALAGNGLITIASP